VLVAYAHGEIPPPIAAFVEHRRPGLDPSAVVPSGFDALRARVAELVDTGASKFVVVPVTDPPNWHDELAALAEALLPLET
jgi:sirohydrochlorin ferrochelatase